MPDDIIIRFSVKDDGSPVIERVNQKIKQTKQETQAIVPGLENARRATMDFAAANAGLIAVAAGAALALKKLYETARQGAELEYTREKFDRLAQSIGTTSDALLRDLQTATRGTVSDMEAMALAADMLSLGLAKNADQAVRLAKVQSGLSMDMNQLVLTLANQTTMRFDQLGVSVDGFDAKVKELKATGMDANEAFKEAFLQQAEAQLEKVGNAADESIGSFKRFEAQWKNVTDRIKKDTAETFAPLIEYMAKGIEGNNNYARALDISGMSQREFAYRAQQSGMSIYEYAESVIAAYEATQGLTGSLDSNGRQAALTADELKALSEANKLTIDGMISASDAAVDFQEKQSDILTQIDDLKKKKEEYYPWEVEKIQDVEDKIQDLSEKYADNADEYEKAMKRKFAMNAIEAIEMEDGVKGFSEAEMAKAQAVLEATGIITDQGIQQQLAMQMMTDAIVTGTIPSAEEYGRILDRVMSDGVVSIGEVQAALDALERNIDINLNVHTNYSEAGAAALTAQIAGEKNYVPNQHALGGSFMIPAPYGFEGFMMGNGDTASGGEKVTITPTAGQQGGNNRDIVRAIMATRTDEKRLARSIVNAMIAAGR